MDFWHETCAGRYVAQRLPVSYITTSFPTYPAFTRLGYVSLRPSYLQLDLRSYAWSLSFPYRVHKYHRHQLLLSSPEQTETNYGLFRASVAECDRNVSAFQISPTIVKLVCDDRTFIGVIQTIAGVGSAPRINGGLQLEMR